MLEQGEKPQMQKQGKTLYSCHAPGEKEWVPIVLNRVKTPLVEELLPNDYSSDISTLERVEAVRIAAEAHRRVRQIAQGMIRPGVSLLSIAEKIETTTKALLGKGYNKGIGFPTGLSLNECAAHDTPNPKSKEVILAENDVLKVDFGTHVDGYIIDSAFTVSFTEEHRELLMASQEALYECLKAAGPDVRLDRIGEVAEEVIRSHEMVVNGRSIPIRPVANLNGHSINRYKIHGGKSVPIVKNSGVTDRMVEGEIYAIETFATTGSGYVVEKGDCSHYMLENPKVFTKLEGGKNLLEYINRTFHTLPFCKRYIGPEVKFPDAYLKHLVTIGGIQPYPPLVDRPDSLVAQFEHTLLVQDAGIEVLSHGDDY